MIVSVEKLRRHVEINKTDEELEEQLLALESSVRKYTNNKFQKIGVRFISNSKDIKTALAQYLKIGDTLEVSQSAINNGLYTIKAIVGENLTLNEPILEESTVLFTKVEYPADVQMGVIGIMRWKQKNEDQNYNPEAEKQVQSESISRHSVTYAKDSTEEDIDAEFGVPKKYTSFLKMYKKARF